MNILKSIGEAVNNAVDYISEKKRKFDKINRIKKCIKQETSAMVKNYITLGKHYYSELRNVPNKDMQRICSAIDSSKNEIKRLKYKLEDINNGCDIKCYCDTIDDEDFCSEPYCSSCDLHYRDSYSETGGGCSCEPVCDCSGKSCEECCDDENCESYATSRCYDNKDCESSKNSFERGDSSASTSDMSSEKK